MIGTATLFFGAILGTATVTAPAGATIAGGPNPKVMALALQAVDCAQKQGLEAAQPILTVIDYSLPSTKPRLWTIDLQSRQVLFNELVAHGKNTGELNAKKFSNKNKSLASSLGLFMTGETYHGKHGLSMRMHGLEPGFNDAALPRAVVVHAAAYVSTAMIKQVGRIGRSWGCPAVRPAVIKKLLAKIAGGTYMFSYYPDATWLKTSAMLNGCKVDLKNPSVAKVLKASAKVKEAKKTKRDRSA